MTKIIMNGCNGKMGQCITGICKTDDDVEIVAMQIAFPINVWINLCDREPNRESEIMDLIDRHLNQIFKIYGSKNGK